MSFEAQVKYFFISQKSYFPLLRYSSSCILSHPMIYKICNVMSISAWDKVHFWIYLLNHNALNHQTWLIDRCKQKQWYSGIFRTIWRDGADFQVLFNLSTYSNYSITNYAKIPVLHFFFFKKVNKWQLKKVNVNF